MLHPAALRQLPDGALIVASNHIWPVDPGQPGHGLALLWHAAAGASDGQPIATTPDGDCIIPGDTVAGVEAGALYVYADAAADAVWRALGLAS